MSISSADMAALSGMYDSAGALQKKQIENQFKLGKDQLAQALKIAQMDSQDKRYGIETQRDISREQIAQARLEMERIGIPRVEIERWVAEKQDELARMELAFKKEVQEQDNALKTGELTGTFGGNPTLAARKMEQDLGLAQGALTGTYNGQPTLDAQKLAQDREQFQQTFGLQQGGLTGTYNGQQTLAGRQQSLDEQERQRQYALEVGKFGADLSTKADTYFQGRRFMGNDAPRLLGMNSVAGDPSAYGSPTPGISTMGQYLGAQYGGAGAGPGGGQAPGAPAGPGGYGALPSEPGARQGAPNVQQGFGAGGPPVPGGLQTPGTPTDAGSGAVGAAGAGLQVGIEPWMQGGGAAMTKEQMGAGSPYGGLAPSGSSATRAPTTNGPPGGMSAQGGMTTQPYDDINRDGVVDARDKQLAAVAKASPPSPYDGLDDQDAASLKLMESIYKKGFNQIPRGELERLQASGREGYLKSAGSMLGYDYNEEQSKYKAYQPSQSASNLA